jgi:hypothetical protein
VGAPEGYDNTNSAIYLSYDGEGTNALAKLDTFTAAGLFSEHYGQPSWFSVSHHICNRRKWPMEIRYQRVTITSGAVYNFTLAETRAPKLN